MDKIHDEILPNALMIGVEHDLFWTLNPKSLTPFIKAFDLRQKYDDTMAWTNGLYIRMAISSCFDKSNKYPTKPLSSSVVKTDKERQQEIKQKMFERMKIINSRFGKEVLNE